MEHRVDYKYAVIYITIYVGYYYELVGIKIFGILITKLNLLKFIYKL